MKLFIRFTMVAVLTAVTIPAIAECSAAEAAAIEKFDRAWGDMARAGDRAGLESIYASEFAAFTAAGTTGKSDSIENAATVAARTREVPVVNNMTHDHYVITCTPSTATISHRNILTPVAAGPLTYTRSVHFLEKRAGKYLVVSSMFFPVDDAMQIEYLEREWSDADLGNTTKWYAENLSDDFHGVSARTGALRSKKDELADSTNNPTTYTSGGITDLDINVDGNLAVASGLWWGVGVDKDKKPVTRSVRYTDTYVKRDGRWMAVASQGTNVATK